jgi:hypothetical protein
VSRQSVVALPHLLCVLALAGTSCRVYDSELLEQLVAGGRAITQANASTTGLDAATESLSDADLPAVVPACGNGRVDRPNERCDTAIAKGNEGACPDGCSQRDGCLAHELMGQRCGARCTPVEITENIPDDGCCPRGATPDSDSDCSATCGNGVLEEGETCDPAESCPEQQACVPTRACTVAQITGSAEACSARCQELPITACESGDGCCPTGCAAPLDSDCQATMSAEPSVPAAEAGTSPGDEDDELAAQCSMVHSGGRCHSCDCAYCAAEVSLCDSITKETAACARAVECALQNHCQGIACFCGDSMTTCQSFPRGPCVEEIREVSGERDFYDVWWVATTPGSALATANGLVQCRADHCAETCGL